MSGIALVSEKSNHPRAGERHQTDPKIPLTCAVPLHRARLRRCRLPRAQDAECGGSDRGMDHRDRPALAERTIRYATWRGRVDMISLPRCQVDTGTKNYTKASRISGTPGA